MMLRKFYDEIGEGSIVLVWLKELVSTCATTVHRLSDGSVPVVHGTSRTLSEVETLSKGDVDRGWCSGSPRD